MVGSKSQYLIWQHFDNIVEEGVAVCKLCKQRIKTDRSFILKKHLQRLHNPKSEIWNHFENIPVVGEAECKYCKLRVRNNHSGNLKDHLIEQHQIRFIEFDDDGELKPNKTSNDEMDIKPNLRSRATSIAENIVISSDEGSGDEVVPTISNVTHNTNQVNIVEASREITVGVPALNYFNPEPGAVVIEEPINTHSPVTLQQSSGLKGKMTKRPEDLNKSTRGVYVDLDEKTVMTAVWSLMMDGGVTPDVFDSKHMKVILQPICDAISEKENKEFKIDEAESERILCEVAKKMRKDFFNDLDCRLLSLKIDMDLKGPANTYCLSTLFVEDGKVQIRNLGIIDLKDEPHFNEQHIKEVLHKFNIDSNQIVNICWDHTKSKYYKPVKNSEYLQEIENFEKYPEIKFGDIKIKPYVGFIAQLCLLDLFKNPNILKPFLQCRNLTKFVNKKLNSWWHKATFAESNLTVPELDSPWKWGSTYKMMHELHQAKHVLKGAEYTKMELNEDHFEDNENLWLFIEAFCEYLSFLQKSIIRYYSLEMHFGDFYAQWLKCKLLTTKQANAKDEKNIHKTNISNELLKSIEARSKEFLGTDCFEACLYMDPRFHHTVVDERKTKAVEYLKKLWTRSKIYSVDVINAATENQDQPMPSQQFDDEEDAFLNEFLCQDIAKERDTKTTEVYNQIEGLKLPFKAVDANILTFWDTMKVNDPDMYNLSCICFAIPTTQNYNLNRYAHTYPSRHISKLSAFTKDNLLNVRLNAHLLDGNLEQFGILYENKISNEELLLELESNDTTSITF